MGEFHWWRWLLNLPFPMQKEVVGNGITSIAIDWISRRWAGNDEGWHALSRADGSHVAIHPNRPRAALTW